MRISSFASVSVLSALLALAAPLVSVMLDARATQPGGWPQGWQVKVNRGTPDIVVVSESEGNALRLKSRESSFALERGVDIDASRFPYLSWKWKVSELPKGGDFRHASTDDQAAQVLVAFADRRILAYIWDSNAPKGLKQSASSVPLLRIFAIVCRSGPSEANQWLTESRNLVADYEAAYGRHPGRVKGLRLQINSQHTRSSAESYFGEVAFRSSSP